MKTILFLILLPMMSLAQIEQQAEQLTFKDVQPIFEKRCANCHGHASSGALFIDFTNYEVVFEKREELHLRVVELKNMPMYSAMPQAERDLINLWISQGATQETRAAE